MPDYEPKINKQQREKFIKKAFPGVEFSEFENHRVGKLLEPIISSLMPEDDDEDDCSCDCDYCDCRRCKACKCRCKCDNCKIDESCYVCECSCDACNELLEKNGWIEKTGSSENPLRDVSKKR